MARVSFESLPEYAVLGGPIGGILKVETEKPIDTARVSLKLTAQEITQLTVQQGHGKNSSAQVLVQRAPLMEQLVSLPFPGSTLMGGEMSAPFSIDLPLQGTPSIATHEMPRERGRFGARKDGCYVEYELEARIDVPWWLDPIDRVVVPVYSPRRVLGAIDPVRELASGDRPGLMIDVDQPSVVPGTPITGSFEITNPGGKHVRGLNLALQRYIGWTAQGRPGQAFGPQAIVSIPVDSELATKAGRFELVMPNTPDATGPWQGQLFQTYWNFTADVDIALGFDVKFSRPLRPV
jgi:hypothetical protein